MAGGWDIITIRNYNDSTTLYVSWVNTSNTIWDILWLSWNSWWAVTALAISIWWTPLPNNTIIANSWARVWGEWIFYDVTPQAETVTGFYLDWTEYKFGWWWIENDTTGTTSTVTKIWAWSEAEFNALSSKDATTIYHVF